MVESFTTEVGRLPGPDFGTGVKRRVIGYKSDSRL